MAERKGMGTGKSFQQNFSRTNNDNFQTIDVYELLPHKKKCCYFQYLFGSFVKDFYCGLSVDE
jgi:hypothetical protein